MIIKMIKKYIIRTYFGILLISPIVLILLPATFFDSGNTICLSVLLFNLECYAYGLTKAIQHLIHLEFNEAIKFNKLSIIVFPILIISYLKELLRVYKLI